MENEWIPSMYETNTINMVENKIIKFKNKISKNDYLINFFENQIIYLDIKTLEIQTIMQNIRLTILNKQNEIVNLHNTIIDTLKKNKNSDNIELLLKNKEIELNNLNLELLKHNFNLQQILTKIMNVNNLLETRKYNLFEPFYEKLKNYLIDEE